MQVFAKRFYGFDPIERPVAAFGIEGNRDALISMSHPGDLLVSVGTRGEPTPVGERDRLLGIVEFARIAVATADFIDSSALRPHDLEPDGTLVWPQALPIVRAWRFDEPRFKLVDVLKEQLTYEASVRAVLLDKDDAEAVLALPKTEVLLPPTEARKKFLPLADALGHPTTGPRPSDWSGEILRNVSETAYTYAVRFGRHDLWKIGHAKDVDTRLGEINKHIPHEVLGAKWALVIKQEWASSVDAYEMEQRVLAKLLLHRTEGERVKCSENFVLSAWDSALRRSESRTPTIE